MYTYGWLDEQKARSVTEEVPGKVVGFIGERWTENNQ
jgi:hypothetical protein